MCAFLWWNDQTTRAAIFFSSWVTKKNDLFYVVRRYQIIHWALNDWEGKMSTWAASCGWEGKMTETACEQKTVSFWLTHFTLKYEPEALCYHLNSCSSWAAVPQQKTAQSKSGSHFRSLILTLGSCHLYLQMLVNLYQYLSPKFILSRHGNNVLNKPIIWSG